MHHCIEYQPGLPPGFDYSFFLSKKATSQISEMFNRNEVRWIKVIKIFAHDSSVIKPVFSVKSEYAIFSGIKAKMVTSITTKDAEPAIQIRTYWYGFISTPALCQTLSLLG